MKLKSLTVSLERSVRRKPYVVSKPYVSLTVDLDREDDLRTVFEEVSEDVRIMVSEMEEIERELKDRGDNIDGTKIDKDG